MPSAEINIWQAIFDNTIKYPLLHRCEHSLHMWIASFFEPKDHLNSEKPFEVKIAGANKPVAKIQKEWPTKDSIDPQKKFYDKKIIMMYEATTNRHYKRGNYDIVELRENISFSNLAKYSIGETEDTSNPSLNQIIEIGLDDGIEHLLKDVSKLSIAINSNQTNVGIIFHICRHDLAYKRTDATEFVEETIQYLNQTINLNHLNLTNIEITHYSYCNNNEKLSIQLILLQKSGTRLSLSFKQEPGFKEKTIKPKQIND